MSGRFSFGLRRFSLFALAYPPANIHPTHLTHTSWQSVRHLVERWRDTSNSNKPATRFADLVRSDAMASEPKLGPNRGNAGKGRPKGSSNKLTADVKSMILAALNKAGGEKYLLKQSQENPVAFMTLVGKVLPMTVAGDPNAPLVTEIRQTLVRP